MTTAAQIKSPPAIAGRAPAPSGGASPTASVDVVKILKKYLWVLMAAGVLGVVVGVAAHIVLGIVHPIFKPQVVFQVLPPTLNTADIAYGKDEDEQERFAMTQVAMMKGDDVIQRVVSDPRLQQNGGEWYQAFVSGGGGFQADDAAEWLQDNLDARLVPNTDIIEMSLGWKDRSSITNVLGLIRETYLAQLEEQTRRIYNPQKDSLEQQINQLDDQYRDKQALRDQILRSDEVDSLEQRFAAASYELNTVLGTLHAVRTEIEGYKTRLSIYEAELNKPGGPTYSDELIQAVEAQPLIQSTRQTITSVESQRQSLLAEGYSPNHRSVQSLDAMIASWRSKLDEQLEEALSKQFAAMVEGLRNLIQQYQAQITDLSNEQQRLVSRLIDLSKTGVKIRDLDMEIQQLLITKAELEKDLQDLRGVTGSSISRRVTVIQQERVPDKPVFPDILIMVPAGIVLVLGLTVTFVFLRELLDQRVKGPSDVAMIPRTRVLGYVPDADEDSATSNDMLSRAMSKAPRGVVAESYRQIRAPLLKQLDLAGHKSVVVLAGLPGSGASTTVSNLAEASAASGKRVLIIDANFRRPSQHKAFGIGEAPGLADVLAGSATLSGTAVSTNTEGLSVLPAGTASDRVVERLSGQQFGEVLAAASAEFDAVFIDVPPGIVAGDGLSIANRCDASVLVVKAYAEKRGLVSRLRNELADCRAEFLGVVVNGVRAAAGGYLRGNIRASQQYAGDK